MRDPSLSPRSSISTVAVVLCVCILALLLPVALVTYPPMVDYPNHLARHAISVMPADHVLLMEFYQFDWTLQPNLAVDVLIVPLLRVLSPLAAGRVILAVAMVLWALAPVVLYRVVWGSWSLWSLLGLLVVYNASLAWGFENYYLTAPVAVLVYAGWLAVRRVWPVWLVLVALTSAVTLVYGGHLFAYGALGIMVVSHAIGLAVNSKGSASKRALQVLCPCVAFAPGAAHFVLRFLLAPSHHGSGTVWIVSLQQKLMALWSPVYTFDVVGDVVVGVGLGALVILAARRVDVHPEMRWALGALAATSLLMPQTLMGVHYTDIRLPALVVLLGVAASRPTSGGFRTFALTVGLSVLVFRSGAAALHWRAHDARVHEVTAAFEAMPQGRRVLAASTDVNSHPLGWHLVCYATLARGAFTPSMFTGGHLLRPKPAYARLDHPQTAPVAMFGLLRHLEPASGPNFFVDWEQDFDVLFVLQQDPLESPTPGLLLSHDGGWFRLYDLPGATERN